MTSKKYIQSFFCLLISVAVMILALDIFSRKMPNVYQYKSVTLNQRANDLKGIILGSSHAYYGINPEYISSNSFSVANVSQDLNYDYFIFNKNIEKLKNLEFVVLPVSIFSLYSEMDAGGQKWRTYNYRHWFDYDEFSFTEVFNIKTYSVFLASPDKLSLFRRILKHYFSGDYDQTWSRSGWGINYNSNQSLKQLLVSGKVAAEKHQISSFNERSLESLKKIIKICDSKNIKLLVVTTPSYFSYNENIDKERLNKTISIISDLVKSSRNVKYINYMNDHRFTSTDFYDADHLNHSGSKKFSIIINSDISEVTKK